MSQEPNKDLNAKNAWEDFWYNIVPGANNDTNGNKISYMDSINEYIEIINRYIKNSPDFVVKSAIGVFGGIYQIYKKPTLERVADLSIPPILELLLTKYAFKRNFLSQFTNTISNFNVNTITGVIQPKLLIGDDLFSVENTVIRNLIQIGLRQLCNPFEFITEVNYHNLFGQFITSNLYRYSKSLII